MCPGGTQFNTPQSYTGKEPAARRASRAKYNPYQQVFNRLEQYIILGQMPQKIELIIMGGNFITYPKNYKINFIKSCFQALNDFSEKFYNPKFNFAEFKKFFELPSEDINSKKRISTVQKKIRKLKKKTTLIKEQNKNETSKVNNPVARPQGI